MKTKPMKIIMRGFRDGVKVFEEVLENAANVNIGTLASRHMQRLGTTKSIMFELEFPDEPEHERYFRFGTDPRGMVMPIPYRPGTERVQ